MSNLYGHGPAHQLMRANTPLDAKGKKGRVRASMLNDALAAHHAGRVQVAQVRASGCFGPEVTDANMGERVVPRVLVGKSVQRWAEPDVPHSFSLMPDVGRTLAAVALDHESWGRPWIVPSITMTPCEIIRVLSNAVNTMPVRVKTIPLVALKVLGVASPLMRDLQEVW